MKTKILELIDKKIEEIERGIESRPNLFSEDILYEKSSKKYILMGIRKEIEKMEEWIPVTERLPEEGQFVICSRIGGDCKIMYGKVLSDGKWFWNQNWKCTHWQPLPLPPNPSSHDNN